MPKMGWRKTREGWIPPAGEDSPKSAPPGGAGAPGANSSDDASKPIFWTSRIPVTAEGDFDTKGVKFHPDTAERYRKLYYSPEFREAIRLDVEAIAISPEQVEFVIRVLDGLIPTILSLTNKNYRPEDAEPFPEEMVKATAKALARYASKHTPAWLAAHSDLAEVIGLMATMMFLQYRAISQNTENRMAREASSKDKTLPVDEGSAQANPAPGGKTKPVDVSYETIGEGVLLG